jgi:hypothetical protein
MTVAQGVLVSGRAKVKYGASLAMRWASVSAGIATSMGAATRAGKAGVAARGAPQLRAGTERPMLVHRRHFIALTAALAACSRAAPGGDPVATIQPLYAPYIENRNPPALLDAAPWTPQLRALLQQAREAERDRGEPIIDFSPLIDGQDWEIASVSVTLTSPPADGRAEVTAHFNNLGSDTRVIYDMVEAGGGWRVDNVRTDHWTLRALLAEAGIA